jgi:2-hydroxymuconate-semialdehyde hydrolase
MQGHRTHGPVPLCHAPAIEPDILHVPVGPGALHVERYGHAERAVVLLHGFGTSSFVWRALAPALVRARWMACAIDLLGHGESDRPADTDFGVAMQVHAIDEALSSLRLARATVIGLDFGGLVALALAAQRPDRVDRLVLMSPMVPDGPQPGPVVEMRRHTGRHALRLSRDVVGAAELLRPYLRALVHDPAWMPESLVARYVAPFVGRDGAQHLLGLTRSLDTRRTGIIARRITQPALVLLGSEQPVVRGAPVELFAGALPAGTMRRLAGVASLAPEEAGNAVARLVVPFVHGLPLPDADAGPGSPSPLRTTNPRVEA